MTIGDRVRNIRGTEEGIVRQMLSGNMVEVEIEDGFVIPFLRSELVVVSANEGKYFKRETPAAADIPIPRSDKGLYVALMPVKESYAVSFINNTDIEVVFTLQSGEGDKFRGLASGKLPPKQSMQAAATLKAADFDLWSTLTVRILYYVNGYGVIPDPLLKKFRLRAGSMFKELKTIPLSNKQGYVLRVDAEAVSGAVSPQPSPQNLTELKAKLEAGQTPANVIPPTPTKTPSAASVTVDLHIEQLSNDFLTMSNTEMLQLQLREFERQLEQAIAVGADEITFIHGVGSGKLREEIHRQLSQHPNVAWYKDAQREKFGYGATLAKLK